MPKIVVKKKAEIYKEFPIRPFQKRITIGSEGDNDLIISDKKVSMHHLLIEKDGTKYFVTDTDSAFGSFVNGQKIEEKTLLISGDEITIGNHTLKFENVLFEKEDNSSFNHSENGKKAQDIRGTEEQLDDSSQHQTKLPINAETYYLLAIYGPYLGKKYQLNFGLTKIGRDNTLNDIVIRENAKGEIDTSISRRHATISYENNNFYITDKRSKTRTFVNQQLLNEDSIVELKPGDEIEIVSDQKSTIFRFVPEGLWNYSPPQKAGDWWTRKFPIISKVGSGIIALLLLINIVSSWRSLSTITQTPSPFTATEQLWFSEDNPVKFYNQPEVIEKLMYSLTPALSDLNGDGINDVVFFDKIGSLHVLNGTNKKPLWSASYKYRIQFPQYFVLADLNKDDLSDIVLPSTDSRIYGIDGRTGNEIWNSPLFEGELSGAPTVADLNGDNILDIFFCNKQGKINVGYGRYGNPQWVTHNTNSEIQTTPAAGDFDGDGIAEVALGTEYGEIFIFKGLSDKFSKIIDVNEELQKAKGSFFEDHQVRSHISIGDLDGDGCDDLVLMTQQGNILALSGKSFKRLWFDELATSSSKEVIPSALGDLDGDKRLDVVIFTQDNKIIAYRGCGQSGGKKKILWVFVPELYENYIAHPVIADVNKDGYGDVIAAGLYNGLYIINGKNGKVLWQNENNTNPDKAVVSLPLVADLGGDKSLDIFIRRANDKFYDIVTNARVLKSTLLWSQSDNNSTHSGSYQRVGMNTNNYVISIMLSLLIIISLTLVHVYVIITRRKKFMF